VYLELGRPNSVQHLSKTAGQWSPPKFNSTDAAASLALLQTSTGTSYIALTTCWFQHTVDVPGPIYPRAGISPLPDEIMAITQLAHSKGISVMIRPCVDPVCTAFARLFIGLVIVLVCIPGESPTGRTGPIPTLQARGADKSGVTSRQRSGTRDSPRINRTYTSLRHWHRRLGPIPCVWAWN
jgi:hypothetical protein